MSAAVTASQPPRVPGLVLGRALVAELTKIVTLRGWWIGAGVMLGLTTAFAVIDTRMIVTSVGGLGPDEFFQDYFGSRVLVERAVLDATLAPAYQSSAFLLPVVVAITTGQEYRRRQILVSALAVPSRVVLFTAKLLAVAAASAGLCLAACLLTNVVLLLMLPARLDAVVFSPAALMGPFRMAIYGIAVAILAAALTSILRSTVFALIAAVMLFFLTVTGALLALSPALHQALPLIGAQSFLFGDVAQVGETGRRVGLVILLAWALAPAAAWGVAFVRRDLA